MDIINRYVYAVTRRLPEKQRGDIEKELRTLIDDMLERYEGSESYEVKVQKVLLDLGDPEIMANNYRSTKRYLIGPQNFDNYIMILKIVMGAVFLGISISIVVAGILAEQKSIVNLLVDYFGTLFSALIQGFAWVTIAFAIAEYNGVNIGDQMKGEEAWNPSELPLIPEKNAAISPWESIIAILFSVVFMTIFLFAPQLIAAYLANGANGTVAIPIFNLEAIRAYRALFIIVFLFGIIKEVLKLVSGRWTLKLAIGFAALSIISTVIMVAIFTNSAIWNPNFAADVMRYTNIGLDFSKLWVKLTGGFIAVMVAACVLDVSTALYKGAKYNITR